MAKGKGSEKKSKKEVLRTESVPPEYGTPKVLNHIIFTINSCEYLKPKYSTTDIIIRVQFMKAVIWESPKIAVTDGDYLDIGQIFTLLFDMTSNTEMDNLISYPISFSITEYPGQMDPEIYAQLNIAPIPLEEPTITCAEDAADLSDMFQDQKIDRTTLIKDVKKGKKGADQKQGKDKKGSKGSKKDSLPGKRGSKGSKSASDKTFELKPPSGSHEVGYGCLDLLPLFLGKSDFSERIVLHQYEKTEKDDMIPKDCLPTLTITVIVDTPWYTEEPRINILNITLEAAYNLPTIIMTNMGYKVCTHIMKEGNLQPSISIGGKVSNKLDREKIKYWPPVTNNDPFSEVTKYRIDKDCNAVRNQLGVNLDEFLNKDVPKIEWNTLKRFFLNGEDTHSFNQYVKSFRKIGLEFLIYPKKDEKAIETVGKKGGKGKDEVKFATAKDTTDESFSEYFHFMTFIDVSTLLYPGVNKVRVVCPFRTYQGVEFQFATAVKDSYFIPKPPEIPPPPVIYKGKGAKGGKGGKGGKGSKESSKASSKGSSKKGGKKEGSDRKPEKTNLNTLLPPPPPPPPEPSNPVYNDSGEQSFIIIEIELLNPINPPRDVEDLTARLHEIVPQRPLHSKVVLDSVLSEQIYKETIKEMSLSLSTDYQNFLSERENCKCDFDDSEQNLFLNYLNKTGMYQTYFTSILRATSLIAEKKFPFNGETDFGNKHYLNHISNVYSYLISEMNEVLNNVITYNIEKQYKPVKKDVDRLLFCAKEALELSASFLARRYYLERICAESRDPQCWFEFAVFNLELQNEREALECVQEALGVDSDHSCSLIFYGYLLAKRGLTDQAETCFLSALAGNQRWLEGWGAAYVFYVSIENQEGADFCLEMAKKYIETDTSNYTDVMEDLAWTMTICPNRIFFRTAGLYIKMRCYEFAEIALSYEIVKHPGLVHYYLAVITYLKMNYKHALIHLGEARNLYGVDFAVLSLEGHCYFQEKNYTQAKESYTRVLELFNRPEDVHLVYVNLSLSHHHVGDDNSALKMMLFPCKYSPTAYTWFMAGIFYFGKNDFLSAEECFTQANLHDNRLADVWAYLTLVNLHLGRYIEADMCYTQTIKNDLKNDILLENVRNAMKES